jgi:hypothetical protein
VASNAEVLLTEIRDALVELVSLSKVKPNILPPGVKPTVAWSAHEKTIASDHELDHPTYGDPVVKSAPRDWNGPFVPGAKMSEHPAEFLDLLADRYDYFATKNDREKAVTEKGYPKSKFDRAAAAKARGWAARIRKGYKPPAPPPMDDETPDWGMANEPPF